MLIIITIVSNITVLESQCISVIFSEFLMSMSYGVNNKAPPSASPHLPILRCYRT